MKTVDINIINGKVWIGGQFISTSLSIDEGKIVGISQKNYLPLAKKSIDAEKYFVLPGMIDSHMHSRDPGSTDREDFFTVTCAAAAGGITTIFDMPTVIPPVSTVSAFEEKKELALKKAVVDFALYAGAGSDNIHQIQGLANAGAIAFKTFLILLSPDRTKEAWGVYVSNDGMFLEVLQAIQATGLISAVHAESNEIIQHYTKKLKSNGRKDIQAFGESRPEISDIEATSKALLFAKYTGARLHICHVGSRGVVELIRQAKASGQSVTSETTPLYLLLSEENLNDLGPSGLIYPPLRSKENQNALYHAFATGDIDIMNSDHAPYTKEEMKKGLDDVWQAVPDGSSIEVMFPLMLNEVNKGNLTLKRVIKSMAEIPACLFGIASSKGFIQIGNDADLVFVDMNAEKIIRGEELHTKQQMTQFEGWKVKGLPILTMVRGRVVADHGEIKEERGWGNFVRPN